MSIDWEDGQKKKVFREAIQAAYPNKDLLEIFVAEELGENLAEINTTENLMVLVSALIKWAISKQRIDDLLEAFQRVNPNNLVIRELEQQSLISQKTIIDSETLARLFVNFVPDDFPDVRRAFRKAFLRELGRDFNEVRPGESIEDLHSVRILLELYDNPILTVRFAKFALEELGRSSIDGGRNLGILQQWIDEFLKRHQISVEEDAAVDDTSEKKAYLLVSIKESGQITKGSSMVNIFAEIWILGEDKLIEFDVSPLKCSFDDVAEHLSEWIVKAEETLSVYGAGTVTLEFFMSCIYLEKNIDDWEVRTELNRLRKLGMHRAFVIRSLDRVLSTSIRSKLSSKWERLINSIKDTGSVKYYLQEACPAIGELELPLQEALALQVIAELPADETTRQEVLYDIISSAVPLVFWYGNTDESTSEQRQLDLTHFLQDFCPSNFADLAFRWSTHRKRSDTASKHLRLLCDCPDRRPSLPDLTQDEDLVVSS